MDKPITYVSLLLFFHLAFPTIFYFLGGLTLKLNASQSGVSLLEKIGFQLLFTVGFNDLQQNPKAHVELVAFYKQRSLNVLLNNVCFRLKGVVVHLDTDLEGSLAQQFRQLFEGRKDMNASASVETGRFKQPEYIFTLLAFYFLFGFSLRRILFTPWSNC